MAERYRDARGRWVSAAALPNLASYFRERYEAGRSVERERIERAPETLPPPPPEPSNWYDQDTERSTIRSANGSPLSGDAFGDMPADADSFQVRFIMPDNPDYPRGWASYTTQDSWEWENIDAIIAEGKQRGASGVGAIVFHRYPS